MEKGTLVSVQVGQIQTYPLDDHGASDTKTLDTAIVKTTVEGKVWVGKTNLAGDEQADLKNHGGPDKAVLAYPVEHYDLWKQEHPEKDWIAGGFGENLTVTHFREDTVCIGDIFRVGDVILQVSQPRQPCHKLAHRWNMKTLPKIVLDNHRSGWYFRVLQEGYLQAGQSIERIERSYPEWNTAYVTDILYHVGDDFDRAERLYQCELLSQVLRDFLRKAIDDNRPQ